MLFSIIIPIYNRAKTLPRLFASLQAQTFRPLEIILVDNRSTDLSYSLCIDFQSQVHREDFQVFVTQEEKATASAARNKGASVAHGDFLFFFDSDDTIDADFLTDVYPYTQESEMICAPSKMVLSNGKEKVRATPKSDLLRGHLLAGTFSTQTMVLHRHLFERVGRWNESIKQWDDWELGVRLLLVNPQLTWLPRKGYHRIYQHSNSITGEDLVHSGANYIKALEAVEAHLLHSTLSFSQRRKSLWALRAKKLLLLVLAEKEQAHDCIKKIIESTTIDKAQRLILFLHRKGMPSAWRCYYWVSFWI